MHDRPANRHVFTTDVWRHAHDVRADDICVRTGCGARRDDPVHLHHDTWAIGRTETVKQEG